MPRSQRAMRRQIAKSRTAMKEVTQNQNGTNVNVKDQIVLDLAIAAENGTLALKLHSIVSAYRSNSALFRAVKSADLDLIESNIKSGEDFLVWCNFAYNQTTGAGNLKYPNTNDLVSALLWGQGVNYLYGVSPHLEKVFDFSPLAGHDTFDAVVKAIRKHKQLDGIIEWVSEQFPQEVRHIKNKTEAGLPILLAAFASDDQINDVVKFFREKPFVSISQAKPEPPSSLKISPLIRHVSLHNFIAFVEAGLIASPIDALTRNASSGGASYLDLLMEEQSLLPLFDWVGKNNLEFSLSHITPPRNAATSHFRAHKLIQAGRLEEFFAMPLEANTALDAFMGAFAEYIKDIGVIEDVYLTKFSPRLWAVICNKERSLALRPDLQMQYLLAPARQALKCVP